MGSCGCRVGRVSCGPLTAADPLVVFPILVAGAALTSVCAAATAGVCAGAGGLIMNVAIGAAAGVASYHVSTPKGRTAQGYLMAGVGGALGVCVVNRFLPVSARADFEAKSRVQGRLQDDSGLSSMLLLSV